MTFKVSKVLFYGKLIYSKHLLLFYWNILLKDYFLFSIDCWNEVSGLKCNSYHPTEGIYNGSEKCTHDDDHVCFVLWRKENIDNKTSLVVIRRGCFHVGLDNHLEYCLQDCIQNPDYDAFKSENVSGFCCCSGDLCNTNFTAVDYEDYESTIAVTTQQGKVWLKRYTCVQCMSLGSAQGKFVFSN